MNEKVLNKPSKVNAICIISTVIATVLLLNSTAYASYSTDIVTDDGKQSLSTFLDTFVYSYGPDDYDSHEAAKSHILDSMLWEGSCYKASWYPYSGEAQRWGVADPKNKWGDSGYAEAKQVDWVFKNIFNGTSADMVLQINNTAFEPNANRYFTGDVYYWCAGGLGDAYYARIRSYEKEGNLYFVKVELFDSLEDSSMGFYDVVVQQKKIDGKDYWSLYSYKKSDSATSFKKSDWFYDVPYSIWYHYPVKWATENGITQGRGSLFVPDDTCSLQEILTFLWRAKGSPEPTVSNPYSNLSSTQWYYKPMIWAYEQGLYKNKDVFQGNGSEKAIPCTRGMIIQMLWQLEGSPSVKTVQGISDVPPGSQYSPAVSWAMRNGVASGTSPSTFSPENPCTRAQTVTILYQYLVKPLSVAFYD